MNKKMILDPFVLQVIISNIPSSIVLGLIPVLSQHMGMSLVDIGIFFLLVRSGSVIGSFFAPRLLSKWAPHVIGAVAEYINCILSLIILLAVFFDIENLLIATGVFKGWVSGTTGVLRFSWLRRLPDFKYNSQLNLITLAVAQGGYAVIGLLLFFSPPEMLAKTLFLIDAATSVLGAQFFWSMKKYGVKALPQICATLVNTLRISMTTQAKRIMFISSMFLYAAMGGGNILLVKYGEQLFGAKHGYAVALTLYGMFFFLGGQTIRWMKSNKEGVILNMKLIFFSLLTMFFSVLLLPSVTVYFLQVVLFSLLFFFYIVAFLQMQSEWFRLSTPENSSQMGAAQSLSSQSLFAVGEWGYSFMVSDYFLRAFFLCLSSGIMFFYAKIRPVDTSLTITSNS